MKRDAHLLPTETPAPAETGACKYVLGLVIDRLERRQPLSAAELIQTMQAHRRALGDADALGQDDDACLNQAMGIVTGLQAPAPLGVFGVLAGG